MIKFSAFSAVLAVLFCAAYVSDVSAQSQEAVPPLPAPIENLVSEGAQIRFLGKDHGLDAWLTVKNGVEQYFYVLPDQKAFMMGVLFDEKGKLVTMQQVSRLQKQGDTLLDNLADFPTETDIEKNKAFEFKSPSEQLFSDVEGSNWIPFGKAEAPVIYSFMDAQCPHCHAFMNDIVAANFLEKGALQIRMIPVGLRDETRAQAAFLLAAPNPQERWTKYMAGDETALPARSDLNQQGVQRNLAIMQTWKFDATPMLVYRDQKGKVKIVRGKPQNIDALIADIAR